MQANFVLFGAPDANGLADDIVSSCRMIWFA
jgi:hypothetical protein